MNPSNRVMDFNPNSLISDVIDFGILNADDFLVIERPHHPNRSRLSSTSPRYGHGQPVFRMPPFFIPIFIPHPIYSPVYQQFNPPQCYFYLPPTIHVQLNFHLPLPVAIPPSIQIQEVPQQAAPEQSEEGINQTTQGASVVSTSTTDSRLSTPPEEDDGEGATKTPYQGNRKSFGKFICENCSRNWNSANTWANMWQSCFHCLENVYPRWQMPHCMSNLLGVRPINMDGQTSAHTGGKMHLTEYCGMCQHLGQNCRFFEYIPQVLTR